MYRSGIRIIDSYEQEKRPDRGYTAAALICLVLIFVIVGVSIWIKTTNRQEQSVLPDFVVALG